MMHLDALHEKIRKHPEFPRVGMIASHRGVVRAFTRDGKPVRTFQAVFDRGAVSRILEEIRKRPGIVEVLVEYTEEVLHPGEDIMLVVVAGDIREHVFSALMDAVEQIKVLGSKKTEVTEDGL